MKRFSLFLLGLFLIYVVYYDLQHGTLSAATTTFNDNQPIEENKEGQSQSFFEVKVKPGETVLTIIEQFHGGLPAPIEDIVSDFEELNTNAKAETILPGKTYRFPNYNQ